MPSPLHQHEHMSGQSRAGAALVAACSAQAHVHGGHGRVVPYDPDINGRAVSPLSLSLTFTDPNLPTGGVSRSVPLIPSLAPRRTLTVSSRGRVFGFLPLNIRHKFLPLPRGLSRLRKQPAKFIFRRISHDLQNLTDALHHHSVLSSVVPVEGKHARRLTGWLTQKRMKRYPT